MIDIKGLDKVDVLDALYRRAAPQGLGFIAAAVEGPGMTRKHLARAIDEKRSLNYPREGSIYFDYFAGRPLKVDIGGDEFDPWLFDRDAGEGAAAEVIDDLRGRQ